MKKGDIVGLMALVLFLGGLGYLFFFAPEASKYQAVDLPGSTLEVSPGMSWDVMQLFKVNLVQDGFITIHESLGGAPGPAIAVSGYLDKGLHDGTGVSLSTPLVHGQTYIGLLHVDNGDQVFVTQDDLPVTSGGEVVRVDFQSDVPVEEVSADEVTR